jgi:hypothetical protein
MPIACKTSALRRLASSNPSRRVAREMAVFEGAEVVYSAATVRQIRMIDPMIAAIPIRGWNSQQTRT